MKKLFLFMLLISPILACNVEKESDTNVFSDFDSLANDYLSLSTKDSKRIVYAKHVFSENLKAFHSDPFNREYVGDESIRLTLVFALSAPIQLLLKDGKLSYFELDYPVDDSRVDSLSKQEYRIKKEFTTQSRMNLNAVLNDFPSGSLCNEFSDFDHEMGVDATVALLEINVNSGYCQIGFMCSKVRLRDYFPNKLMKLLLKELPEELFESREELKEIRSSY